MEYDPREPLPVDADIDEILSRRVLRDLAAVIYTYDITTSTRRALTKLEGQAAAELHSASGITVGEMRDAAEGMLDRYASVTTLQALRAIHLASQQLAGARARITHAARDEGASWTAIGDVFEMSKQAAREWYNKRALSGQEDSGE